LAEGFSSISAGFDLLETLRDLGGSRPGPRAAVFVRLADVVASFFMRLVEALEIDAELSSSSLMNVDMRRFPRPSAPRAGVQHGHQRGRRDDPNTLRMAYSTTSAW